MLTPRHLFRSDEGLILEASASLSFGGDLTFINSIVTKSWRLIILLFIASSVDSSFDEHDIPYDVLWLDIEHTDGKKYMTWDKLKFPSPEQMQKNLAAKGRKVYSSFHRYRAKTRDWSPDFNRLSMTQFQKLL